MPVLNLAQRQIQPHNIPMTKNNIKYGIIAVSALAIVGLATTAYAGTRSGHFGFGHFGDNHTEKFSNLGIDSDQFKEDVAAGQTFEEALNNQDVTKEDLMAQKKEMMKARLDELVASGDLTQEEADAKLEMIENHTFNKDKDGSKFNHQGFKRHHNKGNWHGFTK